MSLSIPTALAANMTSRAPTLAWVLKITRADSQVYRFTSHDRDLALADGTYMSAPGLDVQSLVSSSGLAVDNTEITVLADDALITRNDIAAGRWDGASFLLAQCNWADPSDGVLVRKVGRFGNLKPVGQAFVAELRDLRQPLQQDNTAVLQPTCRYRFGDSKCTKALGPFTASFTVTASASTQQFTDAGISAAADYYTEGEGEWLTGSNAGLSFKVRAHAAGGVFTLAVPTVYAISVGDTGTVIAGCQKTREACKTFGNILNFGGEPDKPSVDELAASASYG